MLEDLPNGPLAAGSKRSWTAAVNALVWAATIAYPFLTWFFLDNFQPRAAALALAGLFVLRFLVQTSSLKAGREKALPLLACVAFLLIAALVNQAGWLLAYPVFVSLLFFAVFSFSLFYPPTIAERLARLEDPNLPPKGVAYTRRVTQVWSGFFLSNAALSAATVWYGDQWLWSLYNGCVFYVLMGLLMLGEMAVRRRVRASY